MLKAHPQHGRKLVEMQIGAGHGHACENMQDIDGIRVLIRIKRDGSLQKAGAKSPLVRSAVTSLVIVRIILMRPKIAPIMDVSTRSRRKPKKTGS
jgi:hypothetical protein